MHVGSIIRKLQQDNGVSCVALSESLCVAPQQLSRWRNAKDLKLSIVIKVADVFGLGLNEFINYGKEAN